MSRIPNTSSYFENLDAARHSGHWSTIPIGPRSGNVIEVHEAGGRSKSYYKSSNGAICRASSRSEGAHRVFDDIEQYDPQTDFFIRLPQPVLDIADSRTTIDDILARPPKWTWSTVISYTMTGLGLLATAAATAAATGAAYDNHLRSQAQRQQARHVVTQATEAREKEAKENEAREAREED